MNEDERMLEARLKEYQPETYKALKRNPKAFREWLTEALDQFTAIVNRERKEARAGMTYQEYVVKCALVESAAEEVAREAIIPTPAEPVWEEGDDQWADEEDALP